MKKRLAWVFVDAFAYYYLEKLYFPGMAKLAEGYFTSPFRPLLGYSHAIIPAIMTGRGPGETNIWNIYEFAPDSSPFRWTEKIPLRKPLDSQPLLRYVVNRLVSYITGYDTANVPLATLPKLAVGRFTNPFLDDGNLAPSSLISQARTLDINTTFHGYPKHRTDRAAVRSFLHRLGIDDFLICYLTGLDKAGHTLGPESQSMHEWCTQLDQLLSKVISEVQTNGYSLILSSDHGMTSVNRRLSLSGALGELGDDVTYFADSTMARFHDASEAKLWKLRDILDSLGTGQTYDLHDLEKFGLRFKDRRFGDLFYVCDPGTVLVPNAFSVIMSNVRGMHGYDPSTRTEMGVVMSDIVTRHREELTFADVYNAIAGHLASEGVVHELERNTEK